MLKCLIQLAQNQSTVYGWCLDGKALLKSFELLSSMIKFVVDMNRSRSSYSNQPIVIVTIKERVVNEFFSLLFQGFVQLREFILHVVRLADRKANQSKIFFRNVQNCSN